ncbi:MAG: hypothetical protein ACR2Q3_18195 [Woeseiaceae bacterium]
MSMAPVSCHAAWQTMTEVSAQQSARNYTQLLDMSDYLVETDLFPRDVLEAYTCWNMEKEITDEQKRHMSSLRGGGQGDYRDGMRRKIANVVDCLANYPQSKRAVITVCNNPTPDHRSDDDAKCVREIHLYLDEQDKLSGTVLLRAQAAFLFPKNIHMIGSIMAEIAGQLPKNPALGTLFYLATILVSDRT